MISFLVNGDPIQFAASPDTPLLWALRDNLGLTGTKYGCGMAQCGACTVIINGEAVRSCVTPVSAVAGKRVSTIEGLPANAVTNAVRAAWLDLDVVQCGYCQSGQVMAAVALLNKNKSPSDQQIVEAMDGNICRCGTYQRVREAVKSAAATLASASPAPAKPAKKGA
jgi:isoquinoline 1-oxidoreductase alpha subunit